MPLDNIIHEMNGVIQEYNLLQLRMNDLGMKLSGLHAKVSYYLNTRKDLHESQPTERNNSEIQHDRMPPSVEGIESSPPHPARA